MPQKPSPNPDVPQLLRAALACALRSPALAFVSYGDPWSLGESPLKYLPTCAENILTTVSTKKPLLGVSNNSWEPVFVYIPQACNVHDFSSPLEVS